MTAALRRLAAFHGVQASYRAVDGRVRRASDAALLAVLRALGAPVESVADADGALRDAQVARWRSAVEPVAVAGERGSTRIALRLPAATRRVSCRLELEDGSSRAWREDATALRVVAASCVDGRSLVERTLPIAGDLPHGYHRVEVEAGGRRGEALLIAAPRRVPAAFSGAWGVTCPTWALRSARNLGAGDLRDVADLLRWAAGFGGSVVVATLPLLAALLDEPFEASPYAPSSRLFWNEFYAALDEEPEFREVGRRALRDPAVRRRVGSLRRAPLVDYRAGMSVRRSVLEEMSRAFYAGAGERREALAAHLRERPETVEYARFRAVQDRRRTPWSLWPEARRGGALGPEDADPERERHHLYAQWVVSRQMRRLSEVARASGPGLYLDFPLGVHPDGFDVFRERESFALGASVGAPPDSFFPQGQDWGFPPLHPRAARARGHRYLAACLRHHLRHAGLLRIDHVMGLHRQYWIPRGFPKAEGVYVRYPADELHAVACLEAERTRSTIVGENLGTVPAYVDRALARHGWLSTHVLEYAARPRPRAALPAVPRDAVASVNTHDMPPFASFWRGRDVPERVALGLLAPGRAAPERRDRAALRRALLAFFRERGLLGRRAGLREVLAAAHRWLASSPARLVLVNLEDLWLETAPLNVPGTWREVPNWRRKLRRTLSELRADPEVARALAAVAAARRGGTLRPRRIGR